MRPSLVIALLGLVPLSVAAQTTETFNTSATWTAPAGVTSVTVRVWGAGGGGSSGGGAGGGGGGGAYASSVLVVIPGNNYTITIGAGGTQGNAGGASSFEASVIAAGGASTTGTVGGAGGTVAASTGTTRFAGGAGGGAATGGNPGNREGGGGGGSATTIADGGAGAGGPAGGAGGTGEGNGGNGGTPGNGVSGNQPGGGGGGKGGSGTSSGNGASGRIVLVYTPATYTISGTILEGVTPVSGVSVIATGGHSQSVNTNLSGVFTFTGVVAGSTGITITPSLAGYTFVPFTRTVAGPVNSNVVGQDFTAVPTVTWTISGTVLDDLSAPVQNVLIDATGGITAGTLTDINGDYSFDVSDGVASVTLTPTLEGYNFTPVNRTVTGPITAHAPNQDFTAIPLVEVIDIFDTNDTWTAPAGVTSVVVSAWGGGGGGASAGGAAAGGGGAGAYAQATVTVVPGNTYPIVVGAGGAPGVAGGNSFFDAGTEVLAVGGGSSTTATGGFGGQALASTGTQRFSGGNGGNASGSTPAKDRGGGGGGGSATATAEGGTGDNGTNAGGGAGGAGEGAGGAGGDADLAGTGGLAPGGGGGGQGQAGSTSGSGAPGRVRVQYFVEVVPPTLHHYAVSHGGTGITCLATPVTITAHDVDHNPVDAGGIPITLSTTTMRGDWTVVLVGSNAVANGTPGDGVASYTFAPGETSVTLALNYTNIPAGNSEAFFIEVSDGTFGDQESTELTFSRAGFRFVNVTDGNETIPVQIGGKPSNIGFDARALGLQAIRASDADPAVCEAAFPDGNDIDIELGAECTNPATCALASVLINGGAIATGADNLGPGAPAYTTRTLSFGANAIAPIVLDYADTGALSLHARYDIPLENSAPSGDFMMGATAAPVVWRPFGFRITATGNPGATAPAGTVYTTAGSAFDVTVGAVLWQLADDATVDGSPDGHGDTDPTNNADLSGNALANNFDATVALAYHLVLPVGGAEPALGGTTTLSGFSAGSASTSVSFGEVGIIELTAAIQGGTYAGATATSAVGASSHVGRFRPHSFNLTVSPSCGPFTYSGQAFEVLVSARNVGSGVTTNYHGAGAFAKLATLSDAGVTTGFTDNQIAALDFVGGEATDDAIAYTFTDAETLPATLTMRAVDADGTTSQGFSAPTTEIRSGRLAVSNANGTDQLGLPVPFTVESWQDLGAGEGAWVVDTDDVCTSIATSDIVDGNYQEGLPAVTITGITYSNGAGSIDLAAPGAFGSVDLTVDLDNALAPWLKFDWTGDATPDNPTGRAVFGIFSGNPRRLYLRELY